MAMAHHLPTVPDGYDFESISFGKATPERLASFLNDKLWDPLKTSSRMRRLLTEARMDAAKSAKLAFVKAISSVSGEPAGLFLLERIHEEDEQALLLKDAFRRGSKPERALDKSFRLRCWFMAYTLPEHRGKGLATWGARLAEVIDLEADPPKHGAIPLIRAVEDALGPLGRGATRSYACRHAPGGVNFPSEAHHLALRFIDESYDGPVFGRPDLASYDLSAAAPTPRAKAKRAP